MKVGGAETDPEDLRLVEAAWAESAKAILSGDWDLVVLDEINYAIGYSMLDAETVAETLRRSQRCSTSSSPAATPTPTRRTRRHRHRDARSEARLQKGILAQRGIEF